jgi:hypothetical protein
MLFVFNFVEIILMRCKSCIILYLYDITSWFYIIAMLIVDGKKKGKGHPCTGTEALYRPYGPQEK